MSSTSDDLFTAVQLREWRSTLTTAVSGLFLFEALTGLFIYFGRFGISSQVSVLIHTIVGLVFLVPYTVYQARHWWTNRPRPFNQHKLLGYLSLVTLMLTGISGLVLTWQAGWSTRISYAWDLVHLIGGFAATAFVIWHLGIILVRHFRQQDGGKRALIRAAQWRFSWRSAALVAVLIAATVMWTMSSPVKEPMRAFPADYQLPFGDNPFTPSLATTATAEAFEPGHLAGSERCGVAGCHAEILAEWQPSTHRYAAMSPFFQGVQGAMAANNGPESTRYCAGCHDPISLFSGSKNLHSDDLSAPGYEEGISCVVCHSIERTDVRGNANYVLAAQPRYLFEDSASNLAAWTSDFLVRAYPRQHVASWSRDLYKTPEYSAACHKQFIDEEINNVGWVQLQNQYDNWQQSRWHVEGDPEASITCRECHMNLTESLDPAAGDERDYNRAPDDGKHRSHRFIGANQYLPTLLDLPGGDEQVRLVEEWLRGETVIPEIADKWTTGPAVPLQIIAPEQAVPGEPVNLRVVVLNNKAGHDFPTGPLDIIQAWIEVDVQDDQGREVFRSGYLDEGGFLDSSTTVFKAEGIDQFGNLIDKHNLWEMVGARFKRTLFPGYSDVASYAFVCPDQSSLVEIDGQDQENPLAPQDVEVVAPQGARELIVTARLRYRKVDQYFLNFLAPGQGLTAPVTDMSWAEARIPLAEPGAAASTVGSR